MELYDLFIEVLPLITGATGAGHFIGEHLLLAIPFAQVDHGGGQLGIVIEVGGESDLVAALVIDRRRDHQLATFYLQLSDPLLVVLLHALAQILGLPAVVATLDPAALHGLLCFELFGGEVGERLGIEGGQLVIQRRQRGILADQGFGRACCLGTIKGRGGSTGQQRGKEKGAKQQFVHREDSSKKSGMPGYYSTM